jgi:hypothetical protein
MPDQLAPEYKKPIGGLAPTKSSSRRRTDRPIIGRLSLLVQLSQRIILGYRALPIALRLLRIGLAVVMLCHKQITPVAGLGSRSLMLGADSHRKRVRCTIAPPLFDTFGPLFLATGTPARHSLSTELRLP